MERATRRDISNSYFWDQGTGAFVREGKLHSCCFLVGCNFYSTEGGGNSSCRPVVLITVLSSLANHEYACFYSQEIEF